jgi:O-methyltransferase
MKTSFNRLRIAFIRGIQWLRAYILFLSPLRMPILNGRAWAARLAHEVLFHSPFKRQLLVRYHYQYAPQQLCFLCKCIEETQTIPGNVAEIGCERGYTTFFLRHFLDDLEIRKEYIALDTFSGFAREDVAHEILFRQKTDVMYAQFQVNKKQWFDAALKQRKMKRVQCIQADVNLFDLRSLGPLSFVLLDVDLYRPTRKALPELYSVLTPGGIIVVDDCDPGHRCWDGAYQAYVEFMQILGIPPQIVYRKLGIIKKAV